MIKLPQFNYNTNKNKHILFCAQLPWDSQVSKIDYIKWMINTIKSINKITNRKIVFRKHPYFYKSNCIIKNISYFDNNFFKLNNINIEISENSLDEDLVNCHCVVSYNSTVLVEAALQGIPIFACSESSIINEIAINDISKIENIPQFSENDIKNCFNKLAYKQWTSEEILNGELFTYYFTKLENKYNK